MNATENGPNDESRDAGPFLELARVKEQRNKLQRELAECRRENRELRAQLGLPE